MSWTALTELLLQQANKTAEQASYVDAMRRESDGALSTTQDAEGCSSCSGPADDNHALPDAAPWWAKLLVHHAEGLTRPGVLKQFSEPMKLVSGCTCSFAEATVLKARAHPICNCSRSAARLSSGVTG
ncbi:unnamed protein product [Symbiodinium sp. CCMP2592]|nr:unnamed protein product [Symbiodinium sp. CCMP2592]